MLKLTRAILLEFTDRFCCNISTGISPDLASPTRGWIGHKVFGTYQSLNRPFLVSRRKLIFLKVFKEVDSMASTLRLFHLLLTRSEKKCCRRSVLHLFFTNFNGCPLVRWQFFSSKNLSNGIFVKPLCILKTSIRYDQVCLSSSVQWPSCSNLSSYGNSLNCGIIRVLNLFQLIFVLNIMWRSCRSTELK